MESRSKSLSFTLKNHMEIPLCQMWHNFPLNCIIFWLLNRDLQDKCSSVVFFFCTLLKTCLQLRWNDVIQFAEQLDFTKPKRAVQQQHLYWERIEVLLSGVFLSVCFSPAKTVSPFLRTVGTQLCVIKIFRVEIRKLSSTNISVWRLAACHVGLTATAFKFVSIRRVFVIAGYRHIKGSW